jgi:hypothetical protein
VTSLSWNWIALEATVTPLVALLLAFPFWRKTETILGNVVGTGVIFATGFGLIWREYVVIDRITKECLEAGTVCFPEPSAFTRFAIYGFIALAEVFVLFRLSLWVEERRRSRDYDPQWR